MRLSILLLVVFSCVLLNSAELKPLKSQNGKTFYRLSNQAISFDVDPQQGGRVIRLTRAKSSTDLAAAPSFADAPGGSGFFCDRIRSARGATARDYEKSPYKVLSSHADAAGAKLKLVSTNGPLTIEKEYRIDNTTAQIQLHYAITNPNKAPFTGRFWSCSAVPTGKDGNVTLLFPPGKPAANLTAALQKQGVRYSSKTPKGGNYFLKESPRDYMAALFDDQALILTAPYEYLSEFYSYHPEVSAQSARLPTLEFFSEPFVLRSLAEGKAEAIRHPEAADPLANYIYRFAIRLDVRTAKQFQFAAFRKKPLAKKSSRFRPSLTEAPAYRSYDTPAIPFLPRFSRPVKVLAIANINSSVELLELTRRVKVDLSIVEISHPHVLNSSTTFSYQSWEPPEPVAALRYALARDYDVIILSQLFERILPKDILASIQKKVKQGTALLYAGATNQFPSLVGRGKKLKLPETLTADRAVAALPVQPKLTAEKVGKGTVLFMRQPMQFNGLYWTQTSNLLPMIKGEIPADLAYWEYYFAWYGKLLRYAVGLKPEAEIRRSEWKPGLWQGSIHSSKAAKAQICLLANGQELSRRSIMLKPGENKISQAFSEKSFERNGRYFCTVLLSTPTDSDCDTAVRTIKKPEQLVNLRTDRYTYDPGTPISGSVEITGSGKLTCTLRDPAGRLLAYHSVPVKKGKQKFSLKINPELLYPLADLTVELKTASGILRDRQSTSVVLRLPSPQKRLNFILWTHGSNLPFAMNYTRKLGELGFNTVTGITTWINSDAMLKRLIESNLRQGMRFAPMSMHRVNLWKVKSIVRDPCLRNPSYRQKIRNDVAKTVAQAAPFGAELYYSGDENSLGHYGAPHDMCHSPHCLAAFRQAMRTKYGTLKKLNRIWKSSFKSWDEVDAPTFAKAAANNNYIPWFEHRLFMMGNVSLAIKQIKEELDRAVPGARLGVSGQLITDVHGAFNWIDALPALDNPTAYVRETDGLPDLIRSFRKPGLSSGAWIGYGAAQPLLRWNYWNQIINGMFSPSFWYCNYFIRRGDGQLSPDGIFIKKLLAEIRNSGAEQMFAEAEAAPSPVALFYSIPSLVAAQISGQVSKLNASNYTLNFNGWSGLLRDLGFQPPQVITHSGLKKLDPERTPVMILPMAQMLSDDDIAALRRYVRQGGTLIADVQPGMFDIYGRKRTKNPLDPLFGVNIMQVRGSNHTGTPVLAGIQLPESLSGGKVKITTGKALGEFQIMTRAIDFNGIKLAGTKRSNGPLAIHRREGKGNTVYLNFLLYAYPNNRLQPATSDPLVNAMRRLLKQVNVPVDRNHRIPTRSMVAEYRADGNRYFGITRAGGTAPAAVELRFNQTGYLYDTMHHRFLGKRSTAQLTLAPYDAMTLALLPQKLEKLSGSLRFANGKFHVTAGVVPSGVTTLIRLEVLVNGSLQRTYTRIKRVNGKSAITIDPGLRPAAGRWQFRLTDLFSGAKTEIAHTIKGN